MYVRPSTPYCGFMRRRTNGGRGEQLYVPYTAAHVLVTAPTETGKTRRVLAPMATCWNGPAVVVSSKDDLMQLIMERRWGPKAVVDMRPVKSPVYPGMLTPQSYDPTLNITNMHEA